MFCSAIRDRVWVILRGVGLGAYGAGVVAGSAVLCWVSKGLAFVALGGGAEGDVFGDGAFSVEHREAGSTRDFLVISPIKVTIMEEASLPWRRSELVSHRGVCPIRRAG